MTVISKEQYLHEENHATGFSLVMHCSRTENMSVTLWNAPLCQWLCAPCRCHYQHQLSKAPRLLDSSNTTWVSACHPRALSQQQRGRRRDVEEETKLCCRHGPALWAAQIHLVWIHSPGPGEEWQGVQVTAEGKCLTIKELLLFFIHRKNALILLLHFLPQLKSHHVASILTRWA